MSGNGRPSPSDLHELDDLLGFGGPDEPTQLPFGVVRPREGYVFGGTGTCSRCHAPMVWWTTPAGKRSPHDPDGTTHFATCPHAASFRRRK